MQDMDKKNNQPRTLVCVSVALLSLCGAAQAVSDAATVESIPDTRQQLLTLKNTVTNLIDELVDAGVIDKGKASLMKETAAAKARVQAARQVRAEADIAAQKKQADDKAIHVQYVPEFVKDQIRDQVRSGLREEVVGAVMKQAEQERWGIPDALPEWVRRIKLGGDLRLREESDLFALKDIPNTYFDLNTVNAGKKGILTASTNPDVFFNNTKDRHRLRERLRLSLNADVTTNAKVGLRLATGNDRDPVSTNQTLGNSGNRFRFAVDRAYLKYTFLDEDTYPAVTFYGGRFANPWLSSNLVFDRDLSFEGLAFRLQHNLAGSGSLMDMDDETRTLFLTFGAFPLQEVKLSSQDKWMLGAQIGTRYILDDQSVFQWGLAYYNYLNVTGRRNSLFSQLNDFSAPGFVQKGNTMFNIRNDLGASELWALASDYDLLDLTAHYDYAGFSPWHVVADFDVVKNLAWDRNDILKRSGGATILQGMRAVGANNPLEDRTLGFYARLTVGWPRVTLRGSWQVFGGYKYLQRDAVLDAYTDSDFLLGGTDAQGWILGGKYGLNDNISLTGRWISADQIDGPPLGIDVLQFDLNARF